MVNVLLHLANTLLLWQLLRRSAVPAAWLAAAVFAVHPVHVESVAWVIELKDVLSGLFYLSAALAWIRFAGEPRPWRYAAALALYGAGMLAKSVVVTLPVALLIWHWWQRGRVTLTDLLRLAPFFLVGAAIMVADLAFNRSQGVGGFDYSVIERVLIAARALWFYLGKLFWPLDLGGIYPHWEVAAVDPLGVGCSGRGPAGSSPRSGVLRKRIGRGPLAGVLFFGVTLAPTLGLVDYNFMLFTFVADRYQYLACIGIIAVVVGASARGIAAARDARRVRDAALNGALVATLLAVLGTLTWQQARPVPGRHHVLQLRHRAQPAGPVCAPQSRQRVAESGTTWKSPSRPIASPRSNSRTTTSRTSVPVSRSINWTASTRQRKRFAAPWSSTRSTGVPMPAWAACASASSATKGAGPRGPDAIKLDPGNAESWTYQGIALPSSGQNGRSTAEH